MSRLANSLIILVLLTLMVGCGGSSVDLPQDVMTKDAYAVVWTDFEAIKPEDGEKLLNDLADDMSDEQPRARLWLSAEADDIKTGYEKCWKAFTKAGCEGMLTVFYRVENTEGEGPLQFTSVNYRRHTFIKAGKSTEASKLKDALDAFAKDDGNDKLKLVAVGEKTGWFWLTREDMPDSAPKMPTKGDEDTVKAFKKLLAEGDGAPVVAAWRMIKPMSDEIEKEMKRESLGDERKEELGRAKATQSVVMSCTPGKSPQVSIAVAFEDSEQAKTFADEQNDEMQSMRGLIKRDFMSAENPPHPSVIDRMVDSLEVKVSGKSATLEIKKATVRDMLNLTASNSGKTDNSASDLTSPASMQFCDPILHVPGADVVPGVRSSYDLLTFGWTRLPQ